MSLGGTLRAFPTLLRIGFAYQRLGESERARQIFRRVREQYPGTVAARTAPLEDA